MATYKPWHKVVTPREDLREGKPLDASEFAVHLDRVRDGRAHKDYQDPERFFSRTYLTKTLTGLAVETIRRLSGVTLQTSPVFNLSTQFGGGKTHALTLLYHLATHGPKAESWDGVGNLMDQAGVKRLTKAATAVFVGTEFDSLSGRGGKKGEPKRFTPWGEIAWQLGGEEAFAHVAAHDESKTAPAGDVIRKMLPDHQPVLILIDELMNYVSRNRKGGLATQTYNFIHNLSEEARSRENVVLAVSIPASELEMGAEDQADFTRFKKLLDRLGKALFMSAETETAEIIRRRLFEWDPKAVAHDGRVMLPKEALAVCDAYGAWLKKHRQQLPTWFPVDHTTEEFKATYPFHPVVLSVFQRKWQSLPRFQQTRGVLRLLALWVSKVFHESFKQNRGDLLLGLGDAPLGDPNFRAAVFEQLGEQRLEAAVTTDISGKKDAFAERLDKEALDTIQKSRLHTKVATAIFFESNGGQTKAEATQPELRLAVGDPDGDIGNVETVLDTLVSSCYYLSYEKNRYRFSLHPNLNKLLADRQASVAADQIEERMREEIRSVFGSKNNLGVTHVYFPEKSGNIPDRPVLSLVVIQPDASIEEKRTLEWIEGMVRESGSSGRTYKSGLIFSVPDRVDMIRSDTRKHLAWKEIEQEASTLSLDESQRSQLIENLKKASRDLRESVWRTYKHIVLLGKDQKLRSIDLGLVHSSSSETLTGFIIERLRSDGEVEKDINPNFLVRNWPAMKEWSTKSVRDAFYASPKFPKLLSPESVVQTIARGVSDGTLAYIGKSGDLYSPFHHAESLKTTDIEISDDMFIITRATALDYLKAQKEKEAKPLDVPGDEPGVVPKPPIGPDPIKKPVLGDEKKPDPRKPDVVKELVHRGLKWKGSVSPQKWMLLYTKVFAAMNKSGGLNLSVEFDFSPSEGINSQKLEDIRNALLELNMNADFEID